MARRDYAYPAREWSGARPVNPSTFKRLLDKSASNVNATDGGSWAPADPITIGGAGLRATVASIAGGVTTGPKAAAVGSLLLGDNDWPTYSPTRSRVVTFPIRDISTRADVAALAGYYHDGLFPGWTIQLLAGTANLLVPLDTRRISPGATLTEARLRFRVGVKPATVPATLPYFQIQGKTFSNSTTAKGIGQVDAWQASKSYPANSIIVPSAYVSNVFYNAGSTHTSGGTEPAANFASATPGGTVSDGATLVWTCLAANDPLLEVLVKKTGSYADAATYYANGAPQDVVMTPNVNQVAIDTDDHSYYLQIVDGSGTFNTYHSLKLTFSAIADARPGV